MEGNVAEKPRRIDVVYKGSKGVWLAVQSGTIIDMAITKADLVASVSEMAKTSDGTTVRIHKRNGELQEERSY
jgi:hypothetical protein